MIFLEHPRDNNSQTTTARGPLAYYTQDIIMTVIMAETATPPTRSQINLRGTEESSSRCEHRTR